MEPLRLRAFFERNVHRPTHAPKVLDQLLRLRGYHRPGNHAIILVAHRDRRRCLMHIEADILRSPLREGRSWLCVVVSRQLHSTSQGRALKMRLCRYFVVDALRAGPRNGTTTMTLPHAPRASTNATGSLSPHATRTRRAESNSAAASHPRR